MRKAFIIIVIIITFIIIRNTLFILRKFCRLTLQICYYYYLSSRCCSSVRCSLSLLISSLLILVISLFLSMYLRDETTSQEGNPGKVKLRIHSWLQCAHRPVHVEHGWELKLIVDLLRSSKCLVELKS